MWPPIRHFLQTMSLRHAHTVAVKPRTPKSYETPEAKDASRQLGIDAGNFIKTGTTQELARIKSRATRLIEDDQFNIEAFQEGHKQAFGRPYDFDFDFFSADKLVCTEVVYRAFGSYVDFPLVEILGRKTLPALEMVRFWASPVGAPQLEFVAFLDGDEKTGTSTERDAEALKASIARPALTWLQGMR